MTGKELLKSGKRFAVTMWEYSWMVQREGKQAEYADWDKVLDELVERGYDCIRIDAFPHVIAKDKEGCVNDLVTFLPIKDNFMWGNHQNVTVNPREDLISFIRKVKSRGLYVGLSSWFNDDVNHRKMEISTPDDFVRIWTETLRLLDEADLLDCVVWVDLCNEFLLKEWCPMVYTEIFGGDPTQEFGEEDFATFVGELSDERRQKVNAFFTKSIEGVRTSYPELLYTFSNQSFGETHFLNGDVSELDLVEPHIWTTDDMAWSSEINYFNALGGDFPDEHLKMYRTAEKLFELDPKRVEDILEGRMTIWADWAKQHNKPLITTEGWTTVVYEDFSHNGFLGEWNWFKEVAEIAVDKAIAKGWQGICTSNFAEPHFEGMWYDVEWHKKLTSRIKDGE